MENRVKRQIRDDKLPHFRTWTVPSRQNMKNEIVKFLVPLDAPGDVEVYLHQSNNLRGRHQVIEVGGTPQRQTNRTDREVRNNRGFTVVRRGVLLTRPGRENTRNPIKLRGNPYKGSILGLLCPPSTKPSQTWIPILHYLCHRRESKPL